MSEVILNNDPALDGLHDDVTHFGNREAAATATTVCEEPVLNNEQYCPRKGQPSAVAADLFTLAMLPGVACPNSDLMTGSDRNLTKSQIVCTLLLQQQTRCNHKSTS